MRFKTRDFIYTLRTYGIIIVLLSNKINSYDGSEMVADRAFVSGASVAGFIVVWLLRLRYTFEPGHVTVTCTAIC